jgi:hypothetical protein
MSRRPLLLLPVLLAATALPVAPALAGENGDDSDSARLHASQGCVTGNRAEVAVSGDDIDNVAFYVDGNLVKRVAQPNSGGRFRISMNCARLSVGAHRASAVVTFEEGSGRARRALRFQMTRVSQVSPRFTG